MTRTAGGDTGLDYFDRMYQVPDPWGYETSWYERRKYALTLACLPRERFRRAFEPGCSLGVLTEQLARRCDEVVACDFHAPTAGRARRRLDGQPNVSVLHRSVPDDWPAGSFDLVVLSEVAYYLADANLEVLIDRTATSLDPTGAVVLVHWRGVTDYPQTGDGVHARWTADDRFSRQVTHVEDAFRIDVLVPSTSTGDHPTPGFG